jgi:hypothetical protein
LGVWAATGGCAEDTTERRWAGLRLHVWFACVVWCGQAAQKECEECGGGRQVWTTGAPGAARTSPKEGGPLACN